MYFDELTAELEKAEKTFLELKGKYRSNSDYIATSHKELFDLEHLLENRKHYKLTAPMLTKISLEISDIRIKRRDAKDENEQVGILIPHYEATIKKLKHQVFLLKPKHEKQQAPVFKPRSKVYDRLGITMETVVIDKKA